MKMSKMKSAILAATSLSLALLSAPVAAQAQGGADRAVAAWAAGDHTTAIGIWMEMPNDADALYNLGQAYRTGRGVPVMADRAEAYYQRALNAGHVRAGEQLGLMFLARPQMRQQGIVLLQDAAKRGSPRANFAVGLILAEPGNGQDLVRARSLIQIAANANVPGASDALSKLSGAPAQPVVRTAAAQPAAALPVVVQPSASRPSGAPVIVRPQPAVRVAAPRTVVAASAARPVAAPVVRPVVSPAPRPVAVMASVQQERPITASERRAARAAAAAAREAAPVPGVATDRPAAPVVSWWQ